MLSLAYQRIAVISLRRGAIPSAVNEVKSRSGVTVTIRSLSKDDDLSGLVALSKQFFHEYEQHHEEFFKIDNLKDEDIINYFMRFIDTEDRKAFIALINGMIVGYITVYIKDQPSFWVEKRVGDISGLMVDKGYRRIGVASQLFAKAGDFFKEKNIKYYTVFTAVNNSAGIEFYKSKGMKPLYTTLIGRV